MDFCCGQQRGGAESGEVCRLTLDQDILVTKLGNGSLLVELKGGKVLGALEVDPEFLVRSGDRHFGGAGLVLKSVASNWERGLEMCGCRHNPEAGKRLFIAVKMRYSLQSKLKSADLSA